MNVDLNRLVSKSTVETFHRLFGQKPQAETPYVVNHSDLQGWDISGFTAVSGSYPGIMALRMKKDFAELLQSKITLSPLNSRETDEIVVDMVAELANTISGSIISDPRFKGARLSLPMAVTGQGHLIDHIRQSEIICLPFRLFTGSFEIEYSFSSHPF